MMMMEDTSLDKQIIATADDAVTTKVAAVKAGYYNDPYLQAFSNHASLRPVQPLIKRGTFARVTCIEKAIRSFMSCATDSASSSVQVVNLGAGKDTTFFRLHQCFRQVRWFEVDHDSLIKEKAALIKQSEPLFHSTIKQVYPDILKVETTTTPNTPNRPQNNFSSVLHLISFDLRDNPVDLFDKLKKAGLHRDVPTLFLLECVLMYMTETSTETLLHSVSKSCTDCSLCFYEPVLGNDPFGKVMEANLTRAGVTTSSSALVQTRTIQQQLLKLKRAGFIKAVGCDMCSAYETILSAEERQKASRCEFLDELEEWMLIMRHYCLVIAAAGSVGEVAKRYCTFDNPSSLGFVKGRFVEM